MLYSSVIPFYSGVFTPNELANITFDNLYRLDEKKDYAFKVPYRRIIQYDTEKLTIQVPSFYIYTDIPYDSAHIYLCTNIRIIFQDGTSISSNISNPVINQTFTNFLSGITLVNYDGYILAVSPPRVLYLATGWPLGPIAIILTIQDSTIPKSYFYYSERLYITEDIHNYIELSWWNDTDLAIGKRVIPYELGYRPTCFIDTQLGKPEYNFEEEIIERLGYKFVQSAISKKIYRCSFAAPEYLCDSLRIMRICNNKRVTRYDFQNYGEYLDPMVMTMDVDWDEQGHLAKVDMSFEVDQVAANPSGYIPLISGDFNNDYNNDFNNQ